MEKTKKRKSWLLAAVVAVVAAGAILAALLVFAAPALRYRMAQAAFNDRDFAAAQEKYTAAGTYRDSEDMAALSGIFAGLNKGNYPEDPVRAPKNPDPAVAETINDTFGALFRKGKSLFSEGNLESALKMFRALGDYGDAEKAADYCAATRSLNDGNLDAAAERFERLGDFWEAQAQAEACRTYLRAVELYEKGDFASMEEAAPLFAELGDFLDAADYAQECSVIAVYEQAQALADAGKYAEAYALLAEADYDDADWQALMTECRNGMDYSAADALYAAGEYYEAYKAFGELGSYRDSAERKAACVQDTPASGVLYQNASYKSSSVDFTIDNWGFTNTYIKLYTADGVLVACIFIQEDSKATIHLPGGDYQMNQAYGDLWFGETDMFGDEGKYSKCTVAGSYVFTLENGYAYTMAADAGGDTVSNETIDPGAF